MQISLGNTVLFHYSLLNEKGEVVDTSREQEPLSFVVGEKQILPGLEEAMLGKSAADKFQVKIKSEQAYGAWDEDRTFDVAKDIFADVQDFKVGLMCELTNEQGEQELVTIIEIEDDVVTVDANHPYAGQDLKFSVEIIQVTKTS